MVFNTKVLHEVGLNAEDQEMNVEYEWNQSFPDDVLERIWIEGMLIENEDIDNELELARESLEQYAWDDQEKDLYYYG